MILYQLLLHETSVRLHDAACDSLTRARLQLNSCDALARGVPISIAVASEFTM